MATTPLTKFPSPGPAANNVFVVHTNEETMVGYDGWVDVPGGSGNGVTWAYNARDAVFLTNVSTNTNTTFTFVMAESAAMEAAGVAIANPTVVVGVNNSCKMVHLSELFKGPESLVTLESNTNTGLCMVVSPPT